VEAKTFAADEQAAGQRLDRWLAVRLSELSRTRLQALIQKRRVCVNRQVVVRPSFLLSEGDAITVELPSPVTTHVERQAIPLRLVYEDEHLVAVDKPEGMVVYPAPGHERGTLINALLHHTTLAEVGAPIRPGIVHRLDKETSGVIVVAKTDAAYHNLVTQFKERTLKKTYLAWVWGCFQETSGRIEAPIGRDPADRKRMKVVQGGKMALSAFVVKKKMADRALLEIGLLTGRTHQIRVHFAHIGHPVVGDPVYGRKRATTRMLLHAWRLELQHPHSASQLALEAAVPEAFKPA